MKLTQKRINECKAIVKQTGYWSDETRKYISNFPYHIATKLHGMMIQFEKGGCK